MDQCSIVSPDGFCIVRSPDYCSDSVVHRGGELQKINGVREVWKASRLVQRRFAVGRSRSAVSVRDYSEGFFGYMFLSYPYRIFGSVEDFCYFLSCVVPRGTHFYGGVHYGIGLYGQVEHQVDVLIDFGGVAKNVVLDLRTFSMRDGVEPVVAFPIYKPVKAGFRRVKLDELFLLHNVLSIQEYCVRDGALALFGEPIVERRSDGW